MEELFIPYKESLALKELGFNSICISFSAPSSKNIKFTNSPIDFNKPLEEGINDYCNGYLSRPLYQQAFKWFREKHNLNSGIYNGYDNLEKLVNLEFWFDITEVTTDTVYFKSFEEAELECLRKLIEIVKSKN